MNENIKEIFQNIELEIIRVLTEFDSPNEPVYSCAFHHFYWDGEAIHDPYFSYNTESSRSSNDPTLRWHPADWPMHDGGTFHRSLEPLYTCLGQVLKNKPVSMWEKTSDYQDEVYCKMCKRLNDTIGDSNSPFENWSLTGDFVIGVFDWERGDIMNELAENSVGKDNFVKLRIFQDDPVWQSYDAELKRFSYRDELLNEGMSNETAWELALEKYPLPKNT